MAFGEKLFMMPADDEKGKSDQKLGMIDGRLGERHDAGVMFVFTPNCVVRGVSFRQT